MTLTLVQSELIDDLSQLKTVDTFSGDASATEFTLTQNIYNHIDAVDVFVDGKYSIPTTAFVISQSGTTSKVVFQAGSVPAAGTNNISVIISKVIPQDNIAKNSVTTAMVQAAAITANELATSAVTTTKINNAAVVTAKIAPAAVDATKIAANAVVNADIKNAEIGIEKLTAAAEESLHSGGHNFFDNPDFRIWQQNTTFNLTAGTNITTSDRWVCGSGDKTATVTREEHTTNIDGSKYFLKFQQLAIPTYYPQILQLIPGINKFSGKTVTISFWAKADATREVNPVIKRKYEFSVQEEPLTAVSLTTSWARYERTVSISDYSSLSVDANADMDGTAFVMLLPKNATFTIEFANFQFETGTTKSNFQSPNLSNELEKCQHFYRKSYNIDSAVQTVTLEGAYYIPQLNSGTHTTSTGQFEIERMRKKPAVKIYSTATGAAENKLQAYGGTGLSGEGVVAASDVNTALLGEGGTVLLTDVARGTTAGTISATTQWGYSFHWTADCNYVIALDF